MRHKPMDTCSPVDYRRGSRIFTVTPQLGGGSSVFHPTFSELDRASVGEMVTIRLLNQAGLRPLMVPLGVIVRHEILRRLRLRSYSCLD